MSRKKDVMIEISKKARRLNTSRVHYLKYDGGHWIRIEADRPSDLGLIKVCLQDKPPAHVRQVHPGIFAVDLPADVWRIVWFVDGGYVCATYANKLERAEDL